MNSRNDLTAICRAALLLFWLPALLPGTFLNAQEIREQARQDVDRLTSSEMQGRGYANRGHIRAAEFLEARFTEIGLSTVDKEYQHSFKVRSNYFENDPQLTVDGKALSLGTHYLPHSLSGSGSADGSESVVRAGYGIVYVEKGINNYRGADVTGAVVVIRDDVPDFMLADTTIAPQAYSLGRKIETARILEAKAVLLLVDELRVTRPNDSWGIPVFQVLRSKVSRRTRLVSFKLDAKFKNVRTNNVLGMLPTRSSNDSLIVLTAHYDHFGSIGDSVYFPGANDNASGVAMLLSIATYFSKSPLRYSLLFAALSGEESGLKGAERLVEKPPFDLDKTKMVLNFDMVASGENGIVAMGGVEHPQLFEMLVTANQNEENVALKARDNHPISDHYPFLNAGFPGLYLYTKDGKQPYHSINDRPETLEWDDYMSVFRLTTAFLSRL